MGQLTPTIKRQKRLKAAGKLRNQLAVLSHTGTKADKKLVKQAQALLAGLSV